MDRKQRLEYLVRKNEGKKYKEEYFREMEFLLNIKVNDNLLISLEETDYTKKILKGRNEKFLASEVSLFYDKQKFQELISIYSSLFESGIYIFSGYSEYCGALFVNSIDDFNVDFSFESEHSGLVIIVSSDVKT